MLEETGYDADEIVLLGSVEPNPAIQNNRCYSYLALNARAVGRQSLDAAEDIEVVLVDPADVPRHILRGEMRHGLVVAAFYLFEQFAGAKHE
jgi:8-oxo-dGTP pyrophosphatase MutT (NUDIX family)